MNTDRSSVLFTGFLMILCFERSVRSTTRGSLAARRTVIKIYLLLISRVKPLYDLVLHIRVLHGKWVQESLGSKAPHMGVPAVKKSGVAPYYFTL
jgi:hypothetical protein